MGKNRIRPIALGLIEHEGHIFVSNGNDSTSLEAFYRFLGGGIDFQESSEAALTREFQEEVQATLTHIEYITCLDNIFTYNGKPKHELIQLFRAQFVEASFYQLSQTFELIEGDRSESAFWIPIDKVRSGEYRLVPKSCIAYLNDQNM